MTLIGCIGYTNLCIVAPDACTCTIQSCLSLSIPNLELLKQPYPCHSKLVGPESLQKPNSRSMQRRYLEQEVVNVMDMCLKPTLLEGSLHTCTLTFLWYILRQKLSTLFGYMFYISSRPLFFTLQVQNICVVSLTYQRLYVIQVLTWMKTSSFGFIWQHYVRN